MKKLIKTFIKEYKKQKKSRFSFLNIFVVFGVIFLLCNVIRYKYKGRIKKYDFIEDYEDYEDDEDDEDYELSEFKNKNFDEFDEEQIKGDNL